MSPSKINDKYQTARKVTKEAEISDRAQLHPSLRARTRLTDPPRHPRILEVSRCSKLEARPARRRHSFLFFFERKIKPVGLLQRLRSVLGLREKSFGRSPLALRKAGFETPTGLAVRALLAAVQIQEAFLYEVGKEHRTELLLEDCHVVVVCKAARNQCWKEHLCQLWDAEVFKWQGAQKLKNRWLLARLNHRLVVWRKNSKVSYKKNDLM